VQKRKPHWRTFRHPRYTKMRGKSIYIRCTSVTEERNPNPTAVQSQRHPAQEQPMLNKVMLIGNLGADPEVRFTSNGTTVAIFRVATTEKWTSKSGEAQQQTEWHNIVAWRRLAEICGEYLTKGSRVYIEGKLQTRKWQDQNGNNRYTTEIVVKEMKMLSPRPENMPCDKEHQSHKSPLLSPPPAEPQTDTEYNEDIPF